MQNTIPVIRKNDLVVQELDNEILIYDLQNNKIFSLNEISALIWQLSNGEKNITEIAQIISQKLSISLDDEFVWLALDQLKKANLIENEIENNYQAATRREIIRRIGLASMVTLPLISTLIAPSASHAQSDGSCSSILRPLGCTCVNRGSCLSDCCGLDSAGNRACITPQTVTPGSPCAFPCNCFTGVSCGLGPVCVPNGSLAPGSPCRGAVNCASDLCQCANPACSFLACFRIIFR